jgi:hypothetical protein
MFSQSLKMLRLIRVLAYSFSAIDSLLLLYFTLVKSKIEYVWLVWNNIATTDANKLERVQQKFAAPYFSRFFLYIPSLYSLHLCLRTSANKLTYFTSWKASP